jgi:glycosyltransferase involved in cell wall biosynthesis
MPKPSKSSLKQIIKIIAFKISFRRNVYVLPISKSVAVNILKLWKIKSPHILPVVYTTSDKVKPTNLMADIDKAKNKIIIGSVGQTIEKKKVDIFIQVAKALTNKYGNDKICFRWAGTGDNLEDYRNQVKCLGLETVVHFMGFLQNLDVFYGSIDIYFHPSDDECLSLSVTEAMKHGKPILAVNIEAMREIIIPEVNGLLAAPNCVEDIVDKLERLVIESKTRHQIGANNAKFYLNNFSKDKWYDSMRQAHEFMIASNQKIFMEK